MSASPGRTPPAARAASRRGPPGRVRRRRSVVLSTPSSEPCRSVVQATMYSAGPSGVRVLPLGQSGRLDSRPATRRQPVDHWRRDVTSNLEVGAASPVPSNLATASFAVQNRANHTAARVRHRRSRAQQAFGRAEAVLADGASRGRSVTSSMSIPHGRARAMATPVSARCASDTVRPARPRGRGRPATKGRPGRLLRTAISAGKTAPRRVSHSHCRTASFAAIRPSSHWRRRRRGLPRTPRVRRRRAGCA